jgi:hypothetical protein
MPSKSKSRAWERVVLVNESESVCLTDRFQVIASPPHRLLTLDDDVLLIHVVSSPSEDTHMNRPVV